MIFGCQECQHAQKREPWSCGKQGFQYNTFWRKHITLPLVRTTVNKIPREMKMKLDVKLQRPMHKTGYHIDLVWLVFAPVSRSTSRWHITPPTSRSFVSSSPESSPHQMVRSTSGHPVQRTWRYMEECCSPWSPWWSDATALTGYTTLMMMYLGIWRLLYPDVTLKGTYICRPMCHSGSHLYGAWMYVCVTARVLASQAEAIVRTGKHGHNIE